MKKFAVFDIDGTLIRWQLYHAVAEALAKQGLLDPKIHQTIKDARMRWKKRTHTDAFRDYEGRLVSAYDRLITQLTPEQMQVAANSVFNEYRDQVYTYTRDLIAQLKDRKYLLLAISGSQTEIVDKIAKHWGLDDWVGSTYTQKGGRYTGAKIVASADKAKILDKLVTEHKLSYKGSIAVGDSASDIKMLELVELPIAFNPEKTLFDHARQHDWKIVVARQNVVYELERTSGIHYWLKTI